ncbi:DUF3558 domain-containing protein [Sciscionella marina]|uniref:DUF3558 domain-containing protein n=1 Tax=Sciscionella marina TaxID=508770 RepID=UPI0009FEEFFE
MRTATLGVLALGATAFVLASCSDPITGTPTSAESSPSQTKELHGAPHVDKPLDTQKFKTDPCSALTPEQLKSLSASLGIGTTGEPEHRRGLTDKCTWMGSTSTMADVGFLQGGGGLSYIYAQRKESPVFEVRPPIDGYPVVHEAGGPERPGDCRVVIGASDDQAVAVDYSQPSGDVKPCDAVTKVATEVVRTLKSAG